MSRLIVILRKFTESYNEEIVATLAFHRIHTVKV